MHNLRDVLKGYTEANKRVLITLRNGVQVSGKIEKVLQIPERDLITLVVLTSPAEGDSVYRHHIFDPDEILMVSTMKD